MADLEPRRDRILRRARAALPAMAALVLLPAMAAGAGAPSAHAETGGAAGKEAFVRFAADGDGGDSGGREGISRRVRSWTPDFVVALGGGYPDGGALPLPGDGSYRDFARGPVHLFAVDSDTGSTGAAAMDGRQARWLRKALAASAARWKIVYFRHPPYSSGSRGSARAMRWPFREWGADAVLAGHDRHYERLEVDGLAYFVNGGGGSRLRPAGEPLPGSRCVYDEGHGAMLVEADWDRLEFRFVTADGVVVDAHTLRKPSVARAAPADPAASAAP